MKEFLADSHTNITNYSDRQYWEPGTKNTCQLYIFQFHARRAKKSMPISLLLDRIKIIIAQMQDYICIWCK